MVEKTLPVPDVSCDHCKMSIEGALKDVTGLASAQVDIVAKTVSLSYDETQVSLDEIIETIAGVGYEVAR